MNDLWHNYVLNCMLQLLLFIIRDANLGKCFTMIFMSFQFKNDLFNELNKVLVSLLNNELKKCPIAQIISGECQLKKDFIPRKWSCKNARAYIVCFEENCNHIVFRQHCANCPKNYQITRSLCLMIRIWFYNFRYRFFSMQNKTTLWSKSNQKWKWKKWNALYFHEKKKICWNLVVRLEVFKKMFRATDWSRLSCG